MPRNIVLVWLLSIIILFTMPMLAPYDPMRTDVSAQNQSPSLYHPLGTDYLGRDLFSRLLFGGRITVGRAVFATLFASIIGLMFASTTYLLGQWIYPITRILTDAVLTIPGLIMALVILTLMGQENPDISMIMALGVSQIAPFTRVTFTTMEAVQHQPYCEAATALGAGRWHILTRCILPNTSRVLFTYARVVFAYCLLNGGALGFLGLGGEPGRPEWGMMLAEGRLALRAAPWAALWPGLALTLLVWLINTSARRHLHE